MEKAVMQPDGTVVWVPIMRVKTFLRDLEYSETTKETNGVIKTVTYKSTGTTSSIIGESSKLLGAASSLSPL